MSESFVVMVMGTTLFELAAKYYGDAARWEEIAAANGIDDPWVADLATISIPMLSA
ncbi:MAG: hypothetical protein ACU0B1_10560 [Thermohalobaculum sp.]